MTNPPICRVRVEIPALRAFLRSLRAKRSTQTVRNVANSLTKLLDDAKAEGWVELASNPMRDEQVRSLIPTVETPAPEDFVHLTVHAAQRLIDAPTTPRERAGLYLLGVTSSMRAGELRGLRFVDFDLDAEIPGVRVTQQARQRRGKGDTTKHDKPKTKNSRRTLAVHAAAKAWLRWWWSIGWREHVGRAPRVDDIIFCNRKGAMYRPDDARMLRRALKSAGVTTTFARSTGEHANVTFHALRRSFSTWLGEAGVNGDLIDRMMGEAPTSTRTRHYQAPTLEAMARAVGTIPITTPPRVGHLETSRESSQKRASRKGNVGRESASAPGAVSSPGRSARRIALRS